MRAGNFLFAGARLFLRSLEAAVFLFSRVARIPDGSSVLPAICTEGVITLGAELVRHHGMVPSAARVATTAHFSCGHLLRWRRSNRHPAALCLHLVQCQSSLLVHLSLHMQEGGAFIRGQNQISHPPRAAGTVDKSGSGPALPAPIRRIFYLSSEGTQQVSAAASHQRSCSANACHR